MNKKKCTKQFVVSYLISNINCCNAFEFVSSLIAEFVKVILLLTTEKSSESYYKKRNGGRI